MERTADGNISQVDTGVMTAGGDGDLLISFGIGRRRLLVVGRFWGLVDEE